MYAFISIIQKDKKNIIMQFGEVYFIFYNLVYCTLLHKHFSPSGL